MQCGIAWILFFAAKKHRTLLHVRLSAAHMVMLFYLENNVCHA